jgi:hypothetical protein
VCSSQPSLSCSSLPPHLSLHAQKSRRRRRHRAPSLVPYQDLPKAKPAQKAPAKPRAKKQPKEGDDAEKPKRGRKRKEPAAEANGEAADSAVGPPAKVGFCQSSAIDISSPVCFIV